MATGHSTVEGAIDAALTGCEEGLEGRAPKEVCGIYYIGDIYVPGMTQEQLDKAIELYKTRDRGQGEGASVTSVSGSLTPDMKSDWPTVKTDRPIPPSQHHIPLAPIPKD